MSKPDKRRSEDGYSMIEMLIGIFILAWVLASAYTLTITTSRIMERNQQLAAASSLAEYKIEELRNSDYDIVTSGSDASPLDSEGNVGGIFSRAWTVTSDSPEAGLKSVVVTVSWSQWGSTHSYTLAGVIGP